MSDDKPINAMYGSKMKLDLDKVKTNSKDKKEVVEETTEKVEKTVDSTPVEETKKEVEKTVDSTPVEETKKEEVVMEDKSQEYLSQIENLKEKLDEKDKKLSNQSNELNYLTNKVIPKLKNEISDLGKVKNELSDALETSTKKYFDQLDINADLSGKIGKIGADGAVNRVRADKLESQLDSIKGEYESKIEDLKDKLARLNVDEIQKENSDLRNQINDLMSELEKSNRENSELSDEINKLRTEIIEIGNYKDEVDKNYKKELTDYKEEVSSLKAQLKVKESSYDKLSNETKRTISDLNNQVAKLEEQLEKQSNRGLFDRFK